LLPLALALAILGVLLFGALFAQVRLGLRPLNGLRAGLAEIRAGRANALSADQPTEIRPLVEELNSLLIENAEGLARARRHVANLAHGLKTPLASLGLALEREERKSPPLASDMRVQLDLMERLIRHHLARARVAALAGPARASTSVRERLADLVSMMGNIHRDRDLQIRLIVASELAVAVETQDFDEIFGNLLDNACKWARSQVYVSAESRDGLVAITIQDDGPGIEAETMPEALRPGRRIDEAIPGHGFGLPIALELTELYGGSLDLSRAADGGLRATARLPKALPN